MCSWNIGLLCGGNDNTQSVFSSCAIYDSCHDAFMFYVDAKLNRKDERTYWSSLWRMRLYCEHKRLSLSGLRDCVKKDFDFECKNNFMTSFRDREL